MLLKKMSYKEKTSNDKTLLWNMLLGMSKQSRGIGID